ncbi:DUF4279 domain-containing protein [Paenibacillus sp. BAC0078]
MRGEFSFSIYADSLDFEEISAMLSSAPSRIIKKGQIVAQASQRKVPFDSWHLKEKFLEDTAPEAALTRLLDKLLPYREEISKLQQKYERVNLNAYLRSEYGQMGIDLPLETVRALGELGLGLSVHILSFGGVELEGK